jgi:hypothetical protein
MDKITMCARISLQGDDDTFKNFITQLQYEYTDKEYRMITEHFADKEDLGKVCFHYKVLRDNVTFWVPGLYCVEYNGEIGIYNKKGRFDNVEVTDDLLIKKGELERRKFSNEDAAPDFAKLTELMLGRRIDNRYVADVDPKLIRLRLDANECNTGIL